MGFFERIGNGISIGFFSIFLPLRHPRLYMYSLLNLVIMGMVFSYIGFVALAQHLLLTSPSYFLSFLIYVVGFTLGSLVYVGLIRTVVGSYQGKSYGFFQAMEVSVTQLFYIFILTFLSTLINQLPGLAPSVASLGVVAFILAFFFGIINTFFLPVLAFERTGFFDIIGRSLRYFGRGIIEIISSMAVVSIVMGLFTGFAVFCIISFIEQTFIKQTLQMQTLVEQTLEEQTLINQLCVIQ